MNNQPQYLMPVPNRYGDGFFDVVVRDARSIVIFWDLNGSPDQLRSTHDADHRRVAVRTISSAGDPGERSEQTLTLHDFAGHLLLPLRDSARDYEIQLGWLDGDDRYTAISSEAVTLPEIQAGIPPQTDHRASVALSAMRHARYGHFARPVERRGFRPGLAS